jgi:hypothetical protein
MSKNDYRFIDKDPVIDVIRTEMQRQGNLSHSQIAKVAYASGVSDSAIHEWLFGKTRRPWSLSTRMVLEAIGLEIQYHRQDGTTVRQSAPTMIPKSEQQKILRAEAEREAKRAAEKKKKSKSKKGK